MHILVTNDDGVYAPGLLAPAQALRAVGDVTVIAPQSNQSTAGHRLTFHKPLRVTEVKLADGGPGLATSGSPADCVALALLGIVKRQLCDRRGALGQGQGESTVRRLNRTLRPPQIEPKSTDFEVAAPLRPLSGCW